MQENINNQHNSKSAISFVDVVKNYFNINLIDSNDTDNYNNTNIINNINCVINHPSVFGLIGINGAGKTTIIKSILNLVYLSKGQIKIFDIDNNDKNSRSKLFYLPENFLPPKNLMVDEFLKSYLKILNVKFNQEKLDKYSAMLDFDLKYLHYKISQCSKGTVQKVGLLLAFLSNAELLILDEPSTGLDVRARNSLKNAISYFYSLGGSVFLSSHIFSDLEQTCTHFGLLESGGFAFSGTKNQLIEKQKNLNVANLEELFLKICTKQSNTN